MSAIVPKNCPKCNNSHKFYRFGKDKSANQKFQCQSCKHQFTLVSLPPDKRAQIRFDNRKYPSCPVCGKASFLHHDFPTHQNLRCCDKKCNHSFFLPKDVSLPDSVSTLFGKTDFKRMRHQARIIFIVLSMYFFGKDSFRQISLMLDTLFCIKLSHVTVSKWCVKFAPIFQNLSLSFLPLMNFDSDEWHADETVVKIRGKKHYLWFVIDSETRFVLGFYLSDRSSLSAHTVMANVKHLGSPKSIVTDRLPAYEQAIHTHFPNANHIQVQDFSDAISNNLIESFNKTFKAWYKTKNGFDSYSSANSLISIFIFFYNFLRPHSQLTKLTPAQVAGLAYNPKPHNIFARSAYRIRTS